MKKLEALYFQLLSDELYYYAEKIRKMIKELVTKLEELYFQLFDDGYYYYAEEIRKIIKELEINFKVINS